MSFEVQLLALLFIKHFICDFPLQATPWMYKNKGTYLHPGGIAHAFIHAAGTGMIVVACLIFAHVNPVTAQAIAMQMAVADGLIHYHIDWAKMNIGSHFDLQPNNSEWFWILLGFDQLLHAATYFGIAYWMPMLSTHCKW